MVEGWEKEMELRRKTTLHVPWLICQGLGLVCLPGCFNNSLYFWELHSGLQDTFDLGTLPTVNLYRLEEYFGERKPL